MSYFSLLSTVLVSSPLIIVCLAGVIVAMTRWRRHPSVSAIVLCAVAVLVLASLLRIFTLPIMMLVGSAARGEYSHMVFLAMNVFSAIMNTTGIGLLLWAAFTARENMVEKSVGKPFME